MAAPRRDWSDVVLGTETPGLELEGLACQTGGISLPRSSAAFDSFNQIATVRIELRDTDPVIWRRVEAPTSITLKALHRIIQAGMGWLDYHLWEFTIDKRRSGLPTDEDWGTEPRTDAAKVRLRDVQRRRKTSIDYLYDFGDCWEHRLTLTNIGRAIPFSSTSPASATRRPRIAAAFPVSTRHSPPPLTPNTRTTPKPRNGSTITIPTSSTSCRSNMPSAASRTSATLPRLASSRKNHRQLPADQPMCIGPRLSPDAYENPEGQPGDEMALKVEGVADGGVHAEITLDRARRLKTCILRSFVAPPDASSRRDCFCEASVHAAGQSQTPERRGAGPQPVGYSNFGTKPCLLRNLRISLSAARPSCRR
jgi:hypothetical protein